VHVYESGSQGEAFGVDGFQRVNLQSAANLANPAA
jgi:hypothetical protein